MATMPVMKLTTNPTRERGEFSESASWFLSRSRGWRRASSARASMNENSHDRAASRCRCSEPPTMVAAERDTPGTMAMDWNSPMRMRVACT